jgi:hypothetical protein
MIDTRDKGFSYFYLKYKKGPYSFELNNDLITFIKTGFIRQIDYEIVPTQYAQSIINDFSELFNQNECATSIIDKTVDEYYKCSLSELLDEVYSLPHPYVKGYTIRSASLRMPLLYKLPDEKVRIPLDITREQAEDLMFNLGTDGLKHWQAVRDDMRSPEYLKYREVFGEC